VALWRNFFIEKMSRENVATLGAEDKPKLLKFDIVSQKSHAHAELNAENGAFIAHPEPKI
jgi:hypothetical protein